MRRFCSDNRDHLIQQVGPISLQSESNETDSIGRPPIRNNRLSTNAEGQQRYRVPRKSFPSTIHGVRSKTKLNEIIISGEQRCVHGQRRGFISSASTSSIGFIRDRDQSPPKC